MEKKNELASLIQEHQKEIVKLAPRGIDKARMMSIFLEAVNNPKLQACTKISVLKCIKKMAEIGTERVGAGGVWLVPFGNELTIIPDWRLIIDKARRAGVITHATAEVVCENDEFSFERGISPKLFHKWDIKKPRGEMVTVYCIYTLPDGSKDFVVMTKDEVEKIRGKSKAKGESSPWATDYWEMAKKTVVKRAMKIFEGASPEITKVIDIDNEAVGYEEIDLPPIEMPKEIGEADEEKEEEPEETPQPFQSFTCSACGKPVKEVVAKYSQEKYGKVLCRECQEKQKK